MVPELSCTYFVRESYSALFKQYFQYGFYKPWVLKKVKSGIRIRHLVPAMFTLYFLTLVWAIAYPIWAVPFILYLALGFYFAFMGSQGRMGGVFALMAFPILHLAYGLGFIIGLCLNFASR
jgi:hypothetical protein